MTGRTRVGQGAGDALSSGVWLPAGWSFSRVCDGRAVDRLRPSPKARSGQAAVDPLRVGVCRGRAAFGLSFPQGLQDSSNGGSFGIQGLRRCTQIG